MPTDGALQSPAWLRGDGPEADIVVSSRVRLARNLAGFPFLTRASEAQQREIEGSVREAVGQCPSLAGLEYLYLPDLSTARRRMLVERRLISKELVEADHPCGVVCAFGNRVSLMINEEDHIRIQALSPGLDARSTWGLVDEADSAIEARLPYAFHPELGYLTACPTNVGTGIRVSVMLHLPALAMTGELEKVFAMAAKIDFVVRGLYGESSEGLGDFYQISNQKTLGRSEDEIVGKLETVIPQVVRYERRVREALMKDDRPAVEDRVFRAYGILSHARCLDPEEALHLLSHLRLGVSMDLLPQFTLDEVNGLFLLSQPAHLRKAAGRSFDKDEARIVRAEFLRKRVAKPGSV